jgi:hypothetical protein
MRTGIANRAGLDPPSLTPADTTPGKDTQYTDGSGTAYGDPEIFATGPDGSRTTQLPLAPGTFQELRLLEANRGSPAAQFTPAASYANVDPQKGGAPGKAGADPNKSDPNISAITSQSPDGVTVPGGVPVSSRKLSYGWSDYSGHMPTFVGAHLKIQWNANPNKPQLNPTPFNTEGPSMNTKYSTPAPFAAGTFIG